MAAAVATVGSPDYGLDAPRIVRSMFSRAAWIIGIALVLYVVNHSEYPGPAARMCGVLALIGLVFLGAGSVMVWSSRVAKLRLRDQLLDSLALRGDERVLDVGCGR
jgi:arsenite methyltransferase